MDLPPISVIGAGIAGLACASFLEQNQLPVQIFERRAQAATRGGIGLLLLKNGIDILDKLGLKEQVSQAGCQIHSFNQYDNKGNTLFKNLIQDCIAIDRVSLLRALQSTIGKSQLHYNTSLERIEFSESNPVVITKKNETWPSSFVIGADGRGSRTRNLLYRDHNLIKTEESEIVGKVNHPEVFDRIGQNFCKILDPEGGVALGLLPLRGGDIIWYLQYSVDKFPNLYTADDSTLFREIENLIGDWSFPVNVMKEIIEPSDCFHWRVELLNKPLQQYGTNTVALIGDAAHPLLTFSSQGANSALVDAYELSKLIIKNQELGKPLNSISEELTQIREPQIQKYRDSEKQLLNMFLQPYSQKTGTVPFSK